jgi:hypothetical protein
VNAVRCPKVPQRLLSAIGINDRSTAQPPYEGTGSRTSLILIGQPSLSHISPHTIRIKGWPTRRTADFTSVTRSSAMMTARVAANKPIIMAAVITFTGLYAVCRANTAELNNNRKGGRSILPRVRSASRAAQNRHAASAAHRRPQATAAPMMPLCKRQRDTSLRAPRLSKRAFPCKPWPSMEPPVRWEGSRSLRLNAIVHR